MNPTKLLLALFLCIACGVAQADTNSPVKKTAEQSIEIDSDSGYYDGNSNQMVYLGNVYVTDYVRATLRCGRLTIDLPASGTPTNILAETNVIVDVLDDKGETNHITADQATYNYSVVTNYSAATFTIVTNEVVVFTGGNPMPEVDNPHANIWAEPLILDIPKKTFSFPGKLRTLFRQATGGTNSSLNFLK